MMIRDRHPGSALLLTVMIIAILTTTTLASIAVRFDQLAATNKIANSTVAKSAADSGLIRLKEKLGAGSSITPTNYDLDTNTESALASSSPRPNPRKIVSTYEKVQTNLPRCLAVAVLTPWVNDGQYLMSGNDTANPAMIFHYANIVNDTPLGIIPGNTGLSSAEKDSTLSSLTNMGHFYNPFAPVGANQANTNYWTINLGGPSDQFLTRKGADGVNSYYKSLDFVYIPYLPKFQDSGLFTTSAGTGVDRVSASGLQTKFEDVIKNNNFKVWLDASVSDSLLAQYGLADLFGSSSDFRLKWLQPSLWNDSPDADLAAPYKTDDAEAAELAWSKKNQPLATFGANDSGWDSSILKGSKSLSFIKLNANQSSTSFTPGATITGLLYGSLDGLRLNQSISLSLLSPGLYPLPLESRSTDMGKLYNVKLTKIGPNSTSGGVEVINVTFVLSAADYDTPKLAAANRYPLASDLDSIVIQTGAQFSTAQSNKSVTISTTNGSNATIIVTTNDTCAFTAGVVTTCPAKGDIISLKKSGQAPLWGRVSDVNFAANGASLDSFVIDKLHRSPKPIREMAYTYFTSGGSPRIAYYGGAINMNDYDGGSISESDELWIYDPEADTWQYPTVSGTTPGLRAGASMAWDSANNRLVMIGGYYHEAVGLSPAADCELYHQTCLYNNRAGSRMAKRVTNDVYALNLGTNSWEKINYTFASGDKIQTTGPNNSYTARVTSTLADRSGLERWITTAKNPTGQIQTIKVDGTDSTVTISPSVAGLAKGDDLYIYGTRSGAGGGVFSAWGKVKLIDSAAGTVLLNAYGYQPASGETQVQLSAIALQVTKRADGVTTCTGGVDGGPAYIYCQLTDATGFGVGDSIVLEQFTGTKLTSSLSGFISYLDSANKAYFVADERPAAINDFSQLSTIRVAGDSAVKFPAMRYGGSLAIRPSSATNAIYWQGAAKNINGYTRLSDAWQVTFAAGGGVNSAVWTMIATNNNAPTSDTFAFQPLRSSSFSQLITVSGPAIIKKTLVDPRTNQSIIAWDNSEEWTLQISSADAKLLVAGASATLERIQSNGAREVFHGLVQDPFSSSCGGYTTTKLCLKHNPSFPGDSEFTGNSSNAKISLTASIDTNVDSGGTATWNSAGGYVQVSNPNHMKVPPVGATAMIWRDPGASAVNAYTFTVKDREYIGGNAFRFFPADRITATPPPNSFMSNAIAANNNKGAVTDLLATLGDHQIPLDGTGAPEWVTTISGSNEIDWKIRKATKAAFDQRPSSRRAGNVAGFYDGANSKLFIAGGTMGSYATLWRQQLADQPSSSSIWNQTYVSATATADLPNLFGGSLVAYKVGAGSIKLVAFGGKQKTDLSRNDYGRTIGPYQLGHPDIDRWTLPNSNNDYPDGTFYLDPHGSSASTSAGAFVSTIENNLPVGTNSTIAKSLSFKSGGIPPTSTSGWTRDEAVCGYMGQSSDCFSGPQTKVSKNLLNTLGGLGRIDGGESNSARAGTTWGKSLLLTDLGDGFKKQGSLPSLILSAPAKSGISTNNRWEQDGYRPYCKDNGAGGCLNLTAGLTYGKLGADFGSDKTAAFIAYAPITEAGKGGAILVSSVGIGNAVATNKGGSNGTVGGWYSYCAKSDSEIVNNNYACKSTATRYLSWLPDPEDMLFTMNASLALASTDTYKVVGYYGGVKRGYLVTSRSGAQPIVYEIVP